MAVKRGRGRGRGEGEDKDDDGHDDTRQTNEEVLLPRRERKVTEDLDAPAPSGTTTPGYTGKKKRRYEKYLARTHAKAERRTLLETLARLHDERRNVLREHDLEEARSGQRLGTVSSRATTTSGAVESKAIPLVRTSDLGKTASGRGASRRERTLEAYAKHKRGEALTEEDEALIFRRQGQSERDLDEIETRVDDVATASRSPSDLVTASEPPLDVRLGSALASSAPVVRRRRKKARKLGDGPENGSSGMVVQADDSSDDSSDGDSRPRQVVAVAESKQAVDTGFKAWARDQLGLEKRENEVRDLVETVQDRPETARNHPVVKDRPATDGVKRGPLGMDLPLDERVAARTSARQPVVLYRTAQMSEDRLKLPILGMEQEIMEQIDRAGVVLIAGETGSGKTTQVPQFLYENGYGSEQLGTIGITQPRRVAAIAMAKRVAREMNLDDRVVSYQIRHDSTAGRSTRIKFMTDGVLLRQLADDFLLRRYSAIIIDEAHERSINTDILIGCLTRVRTLREKLAGTKDEEWLVQPLRLIIMSATMSLTTFADNKALFPIAPPSVIQVEARQYPVTIHFARRTVADYVTEATRKAGIIHRRLPPGGILIFVTGQQEVQDVTRKLRLAHGTTIQPQSAKSASRKLRYQDAEIEDIEFGNQRYTDNYEPDILDSESDIDLEHDVESSTEIPLLVLPLYGLLPSSEQEKVFQTPPPGTRLCVVATNVAETSITIPGIRYVIDSGRAKERRYDEATGVQSFQVDWITKASAEQRAGRAGRTGPGHCYRLYSSAVYEDVFAAFIAPEITRMPVEEIVLTMKAMGINQVANFPFPTAPPREALIKAEKVLEILGAVQGKGGSITALGQKMAQYPLSPRFAKMICLGSRHDCLEHVIALVAGMSSEDPFIRDPAIATEDASMEEKDERRALRRAFFAVKERHFQAVGSDQSDSFRLLGLLCHPSAHSSTAAFCQENFVRYKAMQDIQQLRVQLHRLVQDSADIAPALLADLQIPSRQQLALLRQIICAVFIDQTAIRLDLIDQQRATELISANQGIPYQSCNSSITEPIYISKASILYASKPEYVVYQMLSQPSRPRMDTDAPAKINMSGVTAINPNWLATLGRSLCTFSKPIESKPVTVAQKKDDQLTRETTVVPSFGMGPGKGWPLPPMVITQRQIGGRWVS